MHISEYIHIIHNNLSIETIHISFKCNWGTVTQRDAYVEEMESCFYINSVRNIRGEC